MKPQFELEEDNVSWSLGVDYRLSDDVLVYANVMKGYKAGSMPTLSGSIYEAYEPVVQESLVDYEAGFKARLWNGRASLNGAAFFYDYENKQLRAKFVDPIFNQLDKLLNVPKSEVTGAELEFTASRYGCPGDQPFRDVAGFRGHGIRRRRGVHDGADGF